MSERPFRKGDKVFFMYGLTRPTEGVVKEDLGNLGYQGRRLIVVEFLFGAPYAEPMEIALPVDRLQHLEDAAPAK